MSDAPWPPRPLRWPDEPLSDGVATLDRLTAGDADAVVRACADPDIQRWLPFPDPYTEDDARAFIASVPELAERGDRLNFALRPHGSTELAGAMGVSCGDLNPHGVAGIGYWTAPAFRRRGLTWRGVRLAGSWAAEALPGLRRLEILIQPANHASRGVAERAGARFEGLRRNGLVLRGGGVVDALVYSLLPDEVERASTLQFGVRPAGADVRERPGAYAVVVDHAGGEARVLLVRWRGRYFLPGGGLRGDESAGQALRRELLEETGYAAQAVLPLGQAAQYADAGGRSLNKRCVFFLVEVGQRTQEPSEVDHASEWVTLPTARQLLDEEASAWALERAARRITPPAPDPAPPDSGFPSQPR